MIRRSFALLTRRIILASVVSLAVPAVALAASPAPVAGPAAASVAGPVDVAKKAPVAFKVADGKLATSIEQREPVGTSAEYDTSVGALYAWVKVKNLGDATTITMVWKKDGKTRLAVPLAVGHSTAWKTWSKKGIGKKDAGHWTVEVQDAAGVVLETLSVNVKAAASDVSAK